MGVGLSLVLLGLLAAGRMRRLGLVTVPDFLWHRYQSHSVRFLAAALSLLAIIGILGAQVWASQGVLAILGVDPTYAAVLATLLFIGYTTASGLWGATLTDVVQLVVIFIGIPLVAFGALEAAGGWSGMVSAIELQTAGLDQADYFSWMGRDGSLLAIAVIPVVMYTLIGQDFYQRLFAAKNDRIAVLAAVLAGVLLMVYAVFPAITGMGARALFGESIEPSQAITTVVVDVLGPWGSAVVLGAIVAAIMSTADSLLVAGSAHVTHDMLVKTFGWKPTDRQMLTATRWATACIGILALAMAVSIQAIIELLLLSYTMYAAGVFVPVVIGLYSNKGSAKAALASMISGAVCSLLLINGAWDLWGLPPIIAGAMVSGLAFVLVVFWEGLGEAHAHR